ncbi:hypothetical protein VSU01S_33890 [Vibrio superstes NBRC 103154]|uniref:Uncharacterized protein n=1 Tax=Vibrio superstes NBRC 103154 TaxID=1219062 RepID=A0A511QUV0_9VIBR|nr:hypothetical protein VSU01S_33890 [Vibrio superstes NBRC 103154]
MLYQRDRHQSSDQRKYADGNGAESGIEDDQAGIDDKNEITEHNRETKIKYQN